MEKYGGAFAPLFLLHSYISFYQHSEWVSMHKLRNHIMPLFNKVGRLYIIAKYHITLRHGL